MKKIISYSLVFLLFQFALQIPATSQDKVTPATALQAYLNNGDTAFHWEIKDSFEVNNVKAYDLLLTSQKWREFVWTHQLTIFVPKENKYDGALLFITGGSVENGLPNWNGPDDKLVDGLSNVAAKNSAIVAVVRQTPNQPLFDDLTEDALISYTLHQFKNDGDYSWPLLFPMTKSAVTAMTAVQEFSQKLSGTDIKRFVVSGASKRGWTTWLTGANDQRVTAIAPMVIDILNMPVNLDYQIKAWNAYSIQIEDYVKLGIPQGAHTESGNAINQMVDPYSYRKSLVMPKMIFMGTNDEYWVVDAIKNYYDSIPGRNMICYTPNAGHDLGGGEHAFETLSAFFGLTIADKPYPVCDWKISTKNKKATLTVKTTPDILTDAVLWTAESPNMVFVKAKWTSKSLMAKGKPVVTAVQPFPVSGFKAFYLDLKYKNPNGGEYTQSTRMFVADSKGIK